MLSQTEPPPPNLHHSPSHVWAAARIASLSNGNEGSPGTVWNVQANSPVFASKAEKKPRVGNSPPATPMMTFPFAMRGAIVSV